MPTIIAGQRDTLNIEQSRRKLDAEPKIALFDPQATPLATALFTMGREYLHDDEGRVKVSGVPLMKRVAFAPRVDWWEDQLIGFKTTVNNAAGYNSSATSIVVQTGFGSIFQSRDVIFVPRTGELMSVTSVATDTLTVVRGVGNSGVGVALVNNDEFILIGSSYPEGAASNSGRSTKETNNFNFLQIQRTPIEETRTFSKTELYTEADWAFEVKKQGIEHLKKLERMFWFGKRQEGTDATSGHAQRYSGGIINQFIQTNVTAFPGTMTESDFNSFLELVLARGTAMKYLFCAPRVLTVISNFAQGRLRTVVDEQMYGMTIHEYQSPHGQVKLVREQIFDEMSAYSGAFCAVDFKNIKYRFLKDSDVSLLPNRQNNDVDGRKAEYLSENAIQLQLEAESALGTGVTN